ncbi:hypothetical protein [Variovorax sp.]|uniref:hypothetical protein n=1 Tax=Variovorax sp. TaxID=1871043 RepID=UPI0034596A79
MPSTAISAAPWLEGSATTPASAKRLAASGATGALLEAGSTPKIRATASVSAAAAGRPAAAAAATVCTGEASRSPQNTAAPAASAHRPVVARGACQRAAV